MTGPFNPLSDAELQEIDNFLLFEVDCDESMTMDTLDGYLHAIAIGPITLTPQQWMPGNESYRFQHRSMAAKSRIKEREQSRKKTKATPPEPF